MRIDRLDLIAFGPFTGKSLTLDGPGLQLVYGPNEAGKSSTLRALFDLLFEFEHTTSDAYLHSYAELRVGALLRNHLGETFECVRKKGKLNTLLDADQENPIDDAPLLSMLPNVQRAEFSQQFGIDHPELKKGGLEMVAGGGELGNALFAASSGFTSLSQVQKRLSEEADELYTPRASRRAINAAMKTHEAAQKTIAELQTPSEEFRQRRDALRQQKKKRAEVDSLLASREATEHRIGRIISAIALMSRRDTLLQQQQQLSSAPLLSAGFSEMRRRAELAHNKAQASAESEASAIAAAKEKLAQRNVASAVLSHAAQIETAHETAAIQIKAERDKSQLVLKRSAVLASVQTLMQQLGLAAPVGEEPDITSFKHLQLTTAQRMRIQNLGQQLTKLQTRLEEITARVQQSTTQVRQHKQRLQNLAPPVDTTDLRRVIARITRHGDIETELQQARTLLTQTRRRLEEKAAQLPQLSSGGVPSSGNAPLDTATLLKLPAPPAQLIEERRQQLEAAAAAVASCQAKVATEQAELEKIQQETRKLRENESVPVEEDLAAARQRRGDGWRLVRAQWLGQWQGDGDGKDATARDAALTAFLQSSTAASSAESLPAAFEEAVRVADDVADRLRRDAHHVATLKNFAEERSMRLQQLSRFQQQLEAAEATSAAAQQQWREDWREAGIEPLSPSVMLAWLQQREVVGQLAAELSEQQAACTSRQQLIEQEQQDLTAMLSASNLPAPSSHSLSDLLNAATTSAEELTAAAHEYHDAQRQIQQSQQQAEEAASRQGDVARELAACEKQWSAAITPLGLHPQASPEEANAVINTISTLFEQTGVAAGHNERIQGIEADTQRFATTVFNLTNSIAPDLTATPAFEAAAALHQRLQDARHNDTLHRAHTTQIEESQQKLTAARQQIAAARAQLLSLCNEAGCDEIEQLPIVEQKSNQRREVQQQLADIDERMSDYAGGVDLEEFLAAARQEDADSLKAQQPRLAEEIQQLKQQLSQLDQSIGSMNTELKKFDGRADAANAAEESQFVVATLRDQVEQYARLKLASAVLQQAITRYRDRHQSRVLGRASELFKELTCGSYSELKPVDDDGSLVLTGIRATTGKQVRVEGMSDGSCDQLYLALRLASLENYLDSHPPAPFIADDILVSFDDNRSAAALKVLARLAQRTQVIFFTHHQHLQKLAAKHLAAGEFTAVNLQARQGEHANLLF